MPAPSLKQLAEQAEKMPWEDRAPLMLRLSFQQAMTPELFLEMLQTLQQGLRCVELSDEFRAGNPAFEQASTNARTVIAKATGERQ